MKEQEKRKKQEKEKKRKKSEANANYRLSPYGICSISKDDPNKYDPIGDTFGTPIRKPKIMERLLAWALKKKIIGK
jgi:hypothetical protein